MPCSSNMDIVALWPEDEGTFEQSVDPKTQDAPMEISLPALFKFVVL